MNHGQAIGSHQAGIRLVVSMEEIPAGIVENHTKPNTKIAHSLQYTVAKAKCDSHVCLLSSNFILAYKLNFR
jgi:hypothetical protein